MKDLPSTVVNDLISLGSVADRPAAERDQLLARLKPFSHVNCMGWDHWKEIANALPEEDLKDLLCGLTMAESELNWYGGSVAAVICVYRCYESRFPNKAAQLADWVLARTENPNAAFGSTPASAKSISEFESYDTYLWTAIKKQGNSPSSANPPAPVKSTPPSLPPSPGK